MFGGNKFIFSGSKMIGGISWNLTSRPFKAVVLLRREIKKSLGKHIIIFIIFFKYPTKQVKIETS